MRAKKIQMVVKIIQRKWFRKKGDGSRINFRLASTFKFVWIAAHKNDFDLRVNTSNIVDQIETTSATHLNIRNNDVGFEPQVCAVSIFRTAGGLNRIVDVFNGFFDEGGDTFEIIDDKDLF